MPQCKKCGSFIDEEITICPFCQAKIEPSNDIESKVDVDKQDQPLAGIIYQKTSPVDENENSLVIKTPDLEELVQQEQEEKGISPQLEIIPERKYIIWFIIGIVTVGIGFMIYLFINLEDLERHSHYPNDPRAEPIDVNAMQLLIFFLVALCFGFIPILWWIYYKKYVSLYSHLKKQKHDMAPRKIPHPALYLVPLISSHLIALVPTIVSWILVAQGGEAMSIRLSMPWLFWSIWAIVLVLTLCTSLLDYLWQRALNAHIRMTMANMNIHKELEEDTQKLTLMTQNPN
ncbi:MAG: hypothetical protein FK734_08075 [Asgard group archaeon]|nr:hypothetical protein [Asgard group archaeon]